MNAPLKGFTPVCIPIEKIEEFIQTLVRTAGGPQEAIAFLASAWLFVYDHGLQEGVSIEEALDSFKTTILHLDSQRHVQQ